MTTSTLLDVVQDLLSASSGDTVNSIFDTVESEQVARIVKDCYSILKIRLDIPEVYSLFELESSLDISQPIRMKRPSIAQTIDTLQYDCRRLITDDSNFTVLKFIPLDEFLSNSSMLNATESDVATCSIPINNATVEIKFRNDVSPSYFTSWNTEDILFNSYDASLDTTLQKSKTLAYGRLSSTFQMSDSWVIPFDEAGLALLIQESKTQMYAELRQTDNAISTKKARLLMTEVEKPYWDTQYPSPYSFGRRSKKN